MKKLLSILLSLILFGCSENRVLLDELTDKGTEESPLMYYESGLFNGIGYDVYSNGQISEEKNYVDGEIDGLFKKWFENGQKEFEFNWKDGECNGLFKTWYENGQLKGEGNFKDGKEDGLFKVWYENGQLKGEANFKDGECEDEKCWDENGNEIASTCSLPLHSHNCPFKEL